MMAADIAIPRLRADSFPDDSNRSIDFLEVYFWLEGLKCMLNENTSRFTVLL